LDKADHRIRKGTRKGASVSDLGRGEGIAERGEG